MQLSICCSSRTAELAKRLGERLHRNLDITTLYVQEDAAPVSETWEEGTAAGAILILLDRKTAPQPLRREDWTALIDHDNAPPVAFVRWEECAFPKLLERRPFFPPDSGLDRAVERWVAAMLPEQPGLEPAALAADVPVEWWSELVDKPGRVETTDADAAHSFAHLARRHFQGVAWIGAAGRETALVRAELDYRTPAGRMLAVIAHIDRPLKLPDTRHSYIQVRGAVPNGGANPALGACYAPCFPGALARELNADLAHAVPLGSGFYRLRTAPPTDDTTRQQHLEALQRRFQKWRDAPDEVRPFLAEVPAALTYGFANDWPRAVELSRRTAYVLLADGRRREGIRLWNRLLLAAEERGDRETAEDAQHELSWLTDEDAPVRAATVAVEQLGLFG